MEKKIYLFHFIFQQEKFLVHFNTIFSKQES